MTDTRPHSITVDLTDGQMRTLETIVLTMHGSARDGSVEDILNSLVGCAIADAAEELSLSVTSC